MEIKNKSKISTGRNRGHICQISLIEEFIAKNTIFFLIIAISTSNQFNKLIGNNVDCVAGDKRRRSGRPRDRPRIGWCCPCRPRPSAKWRTRRQCPGILVARRCPVWTAGSSRRRRHWPILGWVNGPPPTAHRSLSPSQFAEARRRRSPGESRQVNRLRSIIFVSSASDEDQIRNEESDITKSLVLQFRSMYIPFLHLLHEISERRDAHSAHRSIDIR